ncbi:zinc finger MYM-type protein 1-like protein [Tanacetum coccineum]
MSRISRMRILPGSSIPGWFSYQNNGDCVKVELPTDWCYEKFKGIAFCLVFSPRRRNGRKSSYGSIGYRFKNFDDCVVKMCGARLVYEDDEQQHEGRPGSRMIQWLPPPSQAEDEPPVKKRHQFPLDFTNQDKIELKLELQHYELDNDPKLKNVTSLSQLCKGLQETEKSKTYPLIDRLIRLILTLPVSTATSERAFSKMKLVKTRLRSTMSDGFLKSSMILSVEREILCTLCTNNVIDDFYSKTQRRVQMKKRKVSS